jgi:GT2 family glycosyltransferase
MTRDLDNSALLSIVVLTWNNFADTAECLHSLGQLNYPRYNIILVDNGSTDGSIERLQATFPKVEIIKNDRNLGYAGGNNIGIKHALSNGAEYLLILNNDTIVDRNLAAELTSISRACNNSGVLGCANYYYDNREKIQFSGGMIDWKTGDVIDTTRHKIDEGQFKALRQVDTVAGSCLFIPATVIKAVGSFDERYFLTFEESDLCCRVKKAGYTVYTCMNAIIWHKVSVSGKAQKQGLNIFEYYSVRNRFLFLIKNSPKRFLPVSLSYHITRTLVYISKDLRKRNMEQARLLLFGLIDGVLFRLGKGSLME